MANNADKHNKKSQLEEKKGIKRNEQKKRMGENKQHKRR